MSDQPDSPPDGMSPVEIRAMEYALGALGRSERKAAEVQMVSDPAFRAAVERWQALLAPLDDATPAVAPPPSVWTAIAAEIDPPRAAMAPRAPAPASTGWWNSLAFWRALGIGGPLVAAVSAALLIMPASSEGGARPLVATMTDSDGKPLWAAAFDPARGEVRFAPVARGAETKGKVPELWVIEGKQPPRSLGVIDISSGDAHVIPRERLAGLKPGAILAISVEPLGGSPTGAPTGPVIATGALSAD